MVTFGAKFKINNNIYNKLSTEEAKTSVTKTVTEYRKFIEHPNVDKLTKNDTIELRRGKHIGGYALELEITNPKCKEPYITGVYTNEKEPSIKAFDLIYQTLLYLCFKSGEKPKIFENSLQFINRVLYNNKLIDKNGKYIK